MTFALIATLAMNSSADRIEFIDDITITRPNSHYVNQRIPLYPTPFQKLPPGAIRGEGWLKVQLDLQRSGFSGQLAKVSKFLDIENNAWMGNGTAVRAGWEELPYWLRGQVSLAYVTGDVKMIAECKAWIEGILKSQKPDGWFGPESNRTGPLGTPDLWPNMLAQDVLRTYYEATGDDRVIKLLTRYVDYLIALPKEKLIDPRHYWHYQRVGDQLAILVWLFNRTGEKKILGLADRLHKASNNWEGGIANRHGVNFAQGFREPATYFLFHKQKKELDATERTYQLYFDQYGRWPGGMYAADENARPGKGDPRQGTEACSVAEMMRSHSMLFEYTADTKWADRLEDIAYNWLPATMTADLKALRYLTCANMAVSDAPSKSPGIENGGPMFLMDPNDHRCCQHNVGMAWPGFVENLWLATKGDGLVCVVPAPASVDAVVAGGTKVKVVVDTNYPFEETVRFRIDPEEPAKFPLILRIPSWADRATITINKKPALKGKATIMALLDREWKKGDVVEMTLPMNVRTLGWSDRQKGAQSIYHGPLVYSLKIDEETKKLARPNGWDAFEIYPKSAWNIGLPESNQFTVKRKPFKKGAQPWTLENVPITLETQGRVIPEWTTDMYGLAAPLQASPVFTKQPLQRVELVPMGAARLRVTVFPTVSSDPKATKWVKPRTARRALPTSWSHRNFFDSEAALSDGLIPNSSDDQDVPRFTWWDHKGTEEWVQYTFEANRTFQSCRVYFFDDTGRGQCRVPESWKIQVKVGGTWQDVEAIDSYTTKKDGWSEVKFKPVGGTEIRLVAKLKKEFSSGILEWEVQ
ncbi:MAG: glycoside hydrolase family 127 protein [Chlorobia bacterium]|nr:glycoside hydrolase family 127 protein [Fimbriimonadaceae bacterium]